MAAALQDYDRALIVGSKSTFGKGTVQRFMNLDQGISGASEIKPLGEVKLTIQKFYRINGGSTQLKGVTPDIVLPDNYSKLDQGERSHDYAMPWTKIDAVEYKQNVFQLNDLHALKSSSADRITKHSTFQKVIKNADRYFKSQNNTKYPLEFKSYDGYMDGIEAEANQYKNLLTEIDALQAKNVSGYLENIGNDEGKKARNNDFLNSIKKDIYIEECLYLMKDLIHQ